MTERESTHIMFVYKSSAGFFSDLISSLVLLLLEPLPERGPTFARRLRAMSSLRLALRTSRRRRRRNTRESNQVVAWRESSPGR